MTKSYAFAKGVLAAAAGLAALGVAATASAQPVYRGYDPCQRDAGNRGVVGAFVGGASGAAIGSQVAASGHRTDGSLLGGVIGALAGAAIGHNTAGCTAAPPPPRYSEAAPPPISAYYQPEPRPYVDAYVPPPAPTSEYYQPEAQPYVDAYAPPPPQYAERDAAWVYGRHGVRFRVVEDRMGPDGCTVAESPVYMPDGRVDSRFVRVCPDRRGRYHIVD